MVGYPLLADVFALGECDRVPIAITYMTRCLIGSDCYIGSGLGILNNVMKCSSL